MCVTPNSSWQQVKSTRKLSHDLSSPKSSTMSDTVLVWLVYLKKSAFMSPVHNIESKLFFNITLLIWLSVSRRSVSSAEGLLGSVGKYELMRRTVECLNLIVTAWTLQ